MKFPKKENRPAQPSTSNNRRPNWKAVIVLVLAVAATFAPTLRNGFIWDDDLYVHENAVLEKPDALKRIWASTEMSQYYPLVYTSFWVERKLWGLSPRGYHTVNIALHGANGALAGAALTALGLPGAWLAAALWALHPVQVETVAWITERKNLLSGLFTLLSFLAYLSFLGLRPRAHPRRWYLASFFLFLAALLSKTTACSLPVVILLVCAWKHSKLPDRKDVLPLIPFFISALGLGLVTIWFENKAGAQGEAWSLSIAQRLLLAGRTSWFYLGKLVWPSPLIFIYPRWSLNVASAWQWLPISAWAVAAGLFWLFRRRRGLELAALSGCFLAVLFPALGFFKVYPFRYSYVADHFQYMACLIPLALAADLIMRLPRLIRNAVAGTALMFLASLSFLRCPAFFSLDSLWQDTLFKNQGAWMAHNNLGNLLMERERYEEAFRHLSKAEELYPTAPEIPNNIGSVLMRTGQPAKALEQFQRSVELQSAYTPAQFNLGLALEALNRPTEAAHAYQAVLRLRPDHAQANNNLGLLLLRANHLAEAARRFQAAFKAQPRYAQAYNNFGITLAMQGDRTGAAASFRKALKLAPDYKEASVNLARLGSN